MHARDIAMFALNLLTVINQTRFSTCNDKMIQLRIGINTGKRWGLPDGRCQWLNAIADGIVLRVLWYNVCTNIERAETLRISKIRTLRLLCCLGICCKFLIVIQIWISFWYMLSRRIQKLTIESCPLDTTVRVQHQLYILSSNIVQRSLSTAINDDFLVDKHHAHCNFLFLVFSKVLAWLV